MSDAQEDDLALKLLHTADWHLGRRFPQFTDEAALELMRARMSVIDAILQAAAYHEVDAVLCAGDLFDLQQPDEQWWQPLAEKLAADYPHVRVLFMSGYTKADIESQGLLSPGEAFLAKPFNVARLCGAIEDLFTEQVREANG